MHIVKEEERVSTGGIILTTETKIQQEESEMGTVVDIGPTAFHGLGDGKPWVKVGDVVTIQRYAGKQLRRGEDIYRVINDEDLITLEEMKDA